MDRNEAIARLSKHEQPWDILVIGGGATGLGAALDAVARGYSTCLLEQHDFAKGTSSRSTKLVHGGVRYLAQGNLSLVMEALRERGRLRKNAAHLVRDQAFVIPCYNWWCIPFYTIGLSLYDLMAGKLGIGRSLPLSQKSTMKYLPCIRSQGLRGGVKYYDCQFDDARLAVNLAQTIDERGGVVLNHFPVESLLKHEGRLNAVVARDQESGMEYKIKARRIINATGVFVDDILKMDRPEHPELVRPSQGIHLVLSRSFMNGQGALMIPKTSDGRVLFAVPWHGHLVVGTTDVEKPEASLEPEASPEEVDYILETAGRFLDCPPGREDVLSVFTGLRPLAAPSAGGRKTKEISRGHKIVESDSGLVTIIGGKWTTYRKMGEDVVRRAARGVLDHTRRSRTRKLRIHGHSEATGKHDAFAFYGADRNPMLGCAGEGGTRVLSDRLNIIEAQVVWAVREEMARSVEDFLSRRTRALQLDAEESRKVSPEVAEIMARELGKDQSWIDAQIESFSALSDIHRI